SLSASSQVRAQALAELHRLSQGPTGAAPAAFPAADPWGWPGAREWTHSPEPIRPTDQPVQLSPSGLSSMSQCQLRWFLERQVKAGANDNPAAIFGTVIHAAISDLITQAQQGQPINAAEALDRYWAACEHDAQWHAELEKGRAQVAVERAANWIAERPGRLVSEHEFATQIAVAVTDPAAASDAPHDAADGIQLIGSIDALEVDPVGGATVWDFKTQSQKTPNAEVAEHLQLQAYQLALQSGEQAIGVDSVQGAGLVHVCVPAGAKAPDQPACGMQPALSLGDTGIAEHLSRAIVSIRAEEFNAEPGKWCRTCPFAAMCPSQNQQKG
nr:PD-(D/E)XK nuclease family protein [Actinomycetes bacterium]